MYSETNNNQQIQIYLKFQHAQYPSMFIMTPKVDRKDLILAAAIHSILALQFKVLTKQCQVLAKWLPKCKIEFHRHGYEKGYSSLL